MPRPNAGRHSIVATYLVLLLVCISSNISAQEDVSALIRGFSWREIGQPLPDYYLPGRLRGAGTFWLAIYGNLLSPGRGVLVYSAYLVLTLIGTILVINRLVRQPLFWFCAVWLVLHLVSVSRLGHWWGGWGFGSRFMTDVMPAWLVLTLLVWTNLAAALSEGWLRGVTVAFAALSPTLPTMNIAAPGR